MIVHMFICSNGKGEAGRGVSTRGREKWQKGPGHLQQDRGRTTPRDVQTSRPKSRPGTAGEAYRGHAPHAVTSSLYRCKPKPQQAMKAQDMPRGKHGTTTYCDNPTDRPAAATPRAAGWTAAGIKGRSERHQRRPDGVFLGVCGRWRVTPTKNRATKRTPIPLKSVRRLRSFGMVDHLAFLVSVGVNPTGRLGFCRQSEFLHDCRKKERTKERKMLFYSLRVKRKW